MSVIEGIIEILEWSNEAIRKELRENKINDTGEASRSLEVRSDQVSAQSLGAFYIEFLRSEDSEGKHGRPPGRMPPIDKIRAWVERKLKIEDEDDIEIATYRVANKIAAIGTDIFIGKRQGIFLNVIADKVNEKVNEHIETFFSIEIRRKLNTFAGAYSIREAI
jgi:hypothetical protein